MNREPGIDDLILAVEERNRNADGSRSLNEPNEDIPVLIGVVRTLQKELSELREASGHLHDWTVERNKARDESGGFTGLLSSDTQRTDLSELSMCKGDQDWCEYPPGYHEAQEAADKAWRAAKES